MAYQTGSASGCANLKSIIETFAQSNGFTLAGGLLHDGTSGWKLTAEDSDQRMMLEAANSTDFLSGVFPNASFLSIDSADWPVTYHLFGHSSPLSLICIVSYSGGFHQYIYVGNIEKYGTWVGGNFSSSSIGHYSNGVKPTTTNALYAAGCNAWGTASVSAGSASCPAAPFWTFFSHIYGYGLGDPSQFLGNGRLYAPSLASYIHAEIDGFVFPGGASGVNSRTDVEYLPCSCWQGRLHVTSPNNFNGRTVLTPHYLFMNRGSGYHSCIGKLGHVRILRVDNYNSGDLITLGSDTWKVFPYYRRYLNPDLISRLRIGSNGTNSGPFGWAIKYEP